MFVTTQQQGGAAPRAEISISAEAVLEDIGALVAAGLRMAGITKP